jgi:hypothetical protein
VPARGAGEVLPSFPSSLLPKMIAAAMKAIARTTSAASAFGAPGFD